MIIFKYLKKSIFLVILFILINCSTFNNIQIFNNWENDLKTADIALNNGYFYDALNLYKNLLEKVELNNKYINAIILFRIAYIYLEIENKTELYNTIVELERLRTNTLPYYYNKKIDDLLTYLYPELNNISGFTSVSEKTNINIKDIIYTVYISNNGNDSSAGTINFPLKSFEAAQLKIREFRNNSLLSEGGLQILFLDNYIIEKPIFLTEEDSGTEKNPLIISGNKDKNVVISGGKNIPIWRELKLSDTDIIIDEQYKNKILVAEFIENNININNLIFGGFASGRNFNTHNIPELFYNDYVQNISSWPKKGYAKIEINERFSNDRIKKWVNENEAWLHGYWGYEWADSYEKINNIDIERRIITLEPPLSRYGYKRMEGRIINAVSEIEQPGEWAVDTIKGLIFYYLPDDFDLNKINISYSTSAFEINNCNYLIINNLEIKQIRGNIININDSENIIIYKCNLNNASGDGLVINGKKNHVIHSTVFKSFGRGGIIISTGDRINLVDSETIIENCSFSDLSRIDKTYTPGILIYGMNQVIRYNKFFDIPSSAIRLETNNVIVELNEFFNCVFESGDQGVIDVYGNPLLQGNIIKWNYFKDIINETHMAASVRLDDFISGFTIYENIFENGSSYDFGAVQVHGGKNNLIEGNIFINCNIVFSINTKGKNAWQNSDIVNYHLDIHNWRTEKWLNKYPYLYGIEDKYFNENYYFDNIIINSPGITKGNFSSSILFNNSIINTYNNILFSDIINYIPNYRNIPINSIGNY